MDDDMRTYLDAMENRLVIRLQEVQDAIVERLRACEASIATLTDAVRSGNATMDMIASLLGEDP